MRSVLCGLVASSVWSLGHGRVSRQQASASLEVRGEGRVDEQVSTNASWWPFGSHKPSVAELLTKTTCTQAFGSESVRGDGRKMPKIAEDFFRCKGRCSADIKQRSYCPPSARVPAKLIEGSPNLKFHEVVVESIPKVMSSTIRRQLIPKLAPKYTNAFRDNRGEQNMWIPCHRPPKDSSEDHAEYRFAFVRDPHTRFLSGLREVATNHAKSWNVWRLKRGKQEFSPETVVQDYLTDLLDGFVNEHTRTQSGYIFRSPSGRVPDMVVHSEDADAGWTKIRKHMGLGPDTPPLKLPVVNHKTTDEYGTDEMPMQFTPNDWTLFCQFYRQDYACLGYAVPSECAKVWKADESAKTNA